MSWTESAIKFCKATARKQVSQNRRRYNDGEFDLDMSFITPRIIAMGYPATESVEQCYRNSLDDVSLMLNKKYGKKYIVINLSERPYDYKCYKGKVFEYGFSDHHAPPLKILLEVTHVMASFLHQDSENVVIVHCMAGKGRTGCVISSLLLLIGECISADEALTRFAISRDEGGSGVEMPCQRRYVRYFEEFLQSHGPTKDLGTVESCPCPTITSIKITCPKYSLRSNMRPFLSIMSVGAQNYPCQNFYNSNENASSIDPFPQHSVEETTSIIEFPVNKSVSEDVIIRFYDMSQDLFSQDFKKRLVWRYQMNTRFLNTPYSMLTLEKKDVDDGFRNTTVDERFFRVHIYLAIPDQNSYYMPQNAEFQD